MHYINITQWKLPPEITQYDLIYQKTGGTENKNTNSENDKHFTSVVRDVKKVQTVIARSAVTPMVLDKKFRGARRARSKLCFPRIC